MFNFKPETCHFCSGPIAQPASGRTRWICPDPDCQRKADAARRRRLRRNRAGLGASRLVRGPQPKGGRDPLVRRAARKLAAERFPHVTVSADELRVLEAAVHLGFNQYSIKVTRKGTVKGIPADLPKEDRRVLHELVTRNAAARPKRQPQLAVVRDVVGTLPEPFSRSPRARGAAGRGRSPGWIVLPDPEEKKLIDLPMPDDRRP